jgi:hypothetical protein
MCVPPQETNNVIDTLENLLMPLPKIVIGDGIHGATHPTVKQVHLLRKPLSNGENITSILL